ncbi:MAG: zinc ABC transporter substrate-binding protein [Geminicoccaceae bacterium]
MHRRALLLVTALAGVLSTLPALAADEPVRVVTTISILGDMIQAVGGDHVAVTALVGPDSDAHAFEPSPADAKALAAARLVVVNGLGLEGWIDRLAQASGYQGAIVTASAGVVPHEMEEDGQAVTDPHAWQDLANGKLYVENIERGLAAADPAHAAAYAANAAAYLQQLDVTDTWVRAELAKVPQAQRKVVSSHDAFGYFTKAYGVTFVAPEGIGEDAEPSAAALKNLIDQVRAEHIKVLFFENALSPRLVEQIARETGAVVGGTLYADALSGPGGPADSYLGMFQHNVPLLRDAMLASGGQG